MEGVEDAISSIYSMCILLISAIDFLCLIHSCVCVGVGVCFGWSHFLQKKIHEQEKEQKSSHETPAEPIAPEPKLEYADPFISQHPPAFLEVHDNGCK